MAVNLNVISQFDSKGLDRARNELDKLAASTSSTSQKLMAGAATAGAGILVGAGAVAAGLYAIGSSFDQAFDGIRIGTGKTGTELETLQNDMKAVAGAVPASFGDAGHIDDGHVRARGAHASARRRGWRHRRHA